MSLLSIFTPTHDTKYLLEAYESLRKQDYGTWEWVVVPNGDAIMAQGIPQELLGDPRVKIIPYVPGSEKDESEVPLGGEFSALDLEAETIAHDISWQSIIAQGAELRRIRDKNRPLYRKICDELKFITGDDPRERFESRHADDRDLRKDAEPEPCKIGALKRFACDNSTGEVLIELDHDDLLVPGILSKVVEAVNAGGEFIYSDAAVFLDDRSKTPEGYNEMYGWETYETTVEGTDYLATRSFQPTPRSLCEIFYAPDHIRCWTRKAYFGSGGHNTDLLVGDDHDLICRTYLAGFKFAHTESCGYLYRSHPGNTVKSHNPIIQQQQAQNRDKYLHQLIDEWVRRENFGYLDLDPRSEPVYHSKGQIKIRRESNTVGCVRAYDSLQHVAQKDVLTIMDEIYRVLVPGGWVCISVPSTDGQGAFVPHAKSYWNSYSFAFFTDSEFSRQLGGPTKFRFQRVRCFDAFPSQKFENARVKYTYADLCALKGQRQPGLVHI